MAKTFLSGPEPDHEKEQLTEAQIIDKKRPSAMRNSLEIFDFAENDMTPAIDQKIKDNEPTIKSTLNLAPKINANENFEAEIKARQAREHAEREERHKKAEAAKKRAEEKRQEKLAQKLQDSQTLDPEELEEKIKEENRRENQRKLYPDPKPFSSDIEDEIWKNRTDKGAVIAERAKLGDVYNSTLSNAIKISISLEFIALIFLAFAYFNVSFSSIGYAIAASITTAVGAFLFVNAKALKHNQIPSDLKKQFFIATIMPGTLLRLAIIYLISLVPIAGNYLAPIVGAFIGADIHYNFLTRYQYIITTSYSLMNILFVGIVLFAMQLPQSGSITSTASIANLMGYVIFFAEYFAGDFAAYRVSYRSK